MWLRENDLTKLPLSRRQLEKHPGRTVLLALGVGFLFGRAGRRG
jgi:hypothetical protein